MRGGSPPGRRGGVARADGACCVMSRSCCRRPGCVVQGSVPCSSAALRLFVYPRLRAWHTPSSYSHRQRCWQGRSSAVPRPYLWRRRVSISSSCIMLSIRRSAHVPSCARPCASCGRAVTSSFLDSIPGACGDCCAGSALGSQVRPRYLSACRILATGSNCSIAILRTSSSPGLPHLRMAPPDRFGACLPAPCSGAAVLWRPSIWSWRANVSGAC